MSSILYSTQGTSNSSPGNWIETNIDVPLDGPIVTAIDVGGFLFAAMNTGYPSPIVSMPSWTSTMAFTWQDAMPYSFPYYGSFRYFDSVPFEHVVLTWGGVPPGANCVALLWAKLP